MVDKCREKLELWRRRGRTDRGHWKKMDKEIIEENERDKQGNGGLNVWDQVGQFDGLAPPLAF